MAAFPPNTLGAIVDDIVAVLEGIKAVELGQTWSSDPIVFNIGAQEYDGSLTYAPTATGAPESLTQLLESIALAVVDLEVLKTAGTLTLPVAVGGHTGNLTLKVAPVAKPA